MSAEITSAGWVGEPLPRGRHGLKRAAVLSSQRERLLRAMLELVSDRGYEATTVPQVVARARVSRNAFYELFQDKTACFLAACDRNTGEILSRLYALDAEADWLQAVCVGTRTYLDWWSQRPAESIAYFVAMPSAGPRAVEQRDRSYRAFQKMFEQLGALARIENASLAPLRPVVPRALVVTITELVSERVRRGQVDHLDRLIPDIIYLTVKLLADEAAAQRALALPRLPETSRRAGPPHQR
jgi:AcrR family transcriptional regulator